MKANAPKKLYLRDTGILGDGISTGKLKDTDIEYTRTDAFIEKACAFINKTNLYLYYCISEECNLVDTDKMIEDFRKYMKGE